MRAVDKSWKHPTGRVPDEVIMLLLGETKRQYTDLLSVAHDPVFSEGAEVWTCNAGFRIWPHDVLFVMDDLANENHKWPEYGRQLKLHERPIITSTAYPQWPHALAYPFFELCEALQLDGLDIYFRNTVPYMLAYAEFLGVKKVTIFGADYDHPNARGHEADRANAEWWLGRGRALGIEYTLASDTTLMHARTVQSPLYGYRHDPRLTLQRYRGARKQADSPQSIDIPEEHTPMATGLRELSDGAQRLVEDSEVMPYAPDPDARARPFPMPEHKGKAPITR